MYYIVGKPNEPEEIIESVDSPKMRHYGGLYGKCSSGFETKEVLMDHNKVAIYRCKECEGVVSLSYGPCREKELMEEHRVCFHCAFWLNVIPSYKRNKRRVVINGNSYYVEPYAERATYKFLGHGGRFCKIKRFDSDEVMTTNNLWHQGSVPQHFRDRLKDNAEFLIGVNL